MRPTSQYPSGTVSSRLPGSSASTATSMQPKPPQSALRASLQWQMTLRSDYPSRIRDLTPQLPATRLLPSRGAYPPHGRAPKWSLGTATSISRERSSGSIRVKPPRLPCAGLLGVRGGSNFIKIRPRAAPPHEVKRRIEDALKRHAETEARHIVVETNGSEANPQRRGAFVRRAR